MKRIPFVPFPLEKATKFSKIFLWLSSRMVKFNPLLSHVLIQSNMNINDREYVSLALFSSVKAAMLTGVRD